MLPKRKSFGYILCFVILVLLLACNLPLAANSTTSQSDLIKTAAAQTLEAQLTEISQGIASATPTFEPVSTFPEPTMTSTPEGGTSETATATLSLLSSATSAPGASPTPRQVCNDIKFVKDVTVPDNTEFPPGKTFEKVWRLQNAGTCNWDSSYTMVIDGANTLNAPAVSPITNKTVPPGGTIDVAVNLKAPDLVGTYRTNFKLRSGSGEVFGMGEKNKPFWAQIEVVVASGLVYDFITKAPQANWFSGTGKKVETELTFGGDDLDPNGVAKIVNEVKLENNATSGKVLLTYPKRVEKGFIQGVFPAYTVQPGDNLKGRLGFMLPAGSCQNAKATYEIYYRVNDQDTSLGKWDIECDGSLTPIDLDLSALKGKSVKFVLVVRAGTDFADDWAIWNSLAVFH